MSVLVKGMKMPKSCAACRFRTSDSESLDPFTDYCYITNARLGRYDNDRAKWKKERRNGCPLVEVSEDAENPCETCWVAENYNLEDDDTPCQNCGEPDAD